jgi:ABC-2 type transport system permease protein
MFHALVEATSTCCNIIVSNNNLVKKVAFPSEALPVPVAMVSVVLYLVGAIVCVAVGIISGVFTPGWSILALPLVVIVQFMMVMGIGLLLGNANVFVRDVGHLWRIFSMAWMFLSPVFWTPNMLFETMGPDSIVPGLMMNGNPAYPLIMAQRIALAGELPDKGMVDLWGNLGIASLWAIGFIIVGFTTFVANKHKHSDII